MSGPMRYFDVVTEKWNDVRASLFKNEVRDSAIRKASLASYMVVADVGIGAGFIAEGVAPLVRRVYGLDVSASALATAQRNLERFKNVELRLIGGNNLSLEDNSVDVVFGNMYLHHSPDPLAALKETVRVLKPSGQLIIVEVKKHDYEWMREEIDDIWLGFERDQLERWFAEAGLVNIDFDDVPTQCCVKSHRHQEVYVSVLIASATKPNSCLKDEVIKQYGRLADEPGIRSLPWDLYKDVAEDLRSVPDEAIAMSMGCGNPVVAANLQEGERVLDIGCGAGPDVLLAALKVGPRGKVIGLDLTAAMLNRLCGIAQETGFSSVLLVNGDGEAIPLASESVDVILSNSSINLAIDKGRVFHEMFRVLRPGGRFCIADVVTDLPLPQCLKRNTLEWVRCFAGALTQDEYLRLLNQAGFHNVTLTRGEVFELYGDTSFYSVLVRGEKT